MYTKVICIFSSLLSFLLWGVPGHSGHFWGAVCKVVGTYSLCGSLCRDKTVDGHPEVPCRILGVGASEYFSGEKVCPFDSSPKVP